MNSAHGQRGRSGNSGYAPKVALLYSRFFYLTILLVCGVIIAGMRRRKGMKLLDEEILPSLRRTFAGLLISLSIVIGPGIMIAGLAVEDIVPSSSRLRGN